MRNLVWLCSCMLMLAAGCGDDAKGNPDAGDGSVGMSGDGDGTGGTGNGTGGTGGDGDGVTGDGDAGVAGDGDGVTGDGDGDGDGGSNVNVGPTGLPLDGKLKTPCYTDDDCLGALGCYGGSTGGLGGVQLGYCAETCTNDRECTDIDGVLTLCSDNSNLCRVDCTDDGAGDGTDGTCPTGFECSANRCLPADNARATKGAFEACDPGLVECSGDQVCAEQNLLGLPLPLLNTPQGFCTSECSEDADCPSDGGAGGTAKCIAMGFRGRCVVTCDDDRQCPAGMTCESTGLLSANACALAN